LRIILVGFGNVSRSLAKLLIKEKDWLIKTYGFEPQVTTIIDSQGMCRDDKGLDLDTVLKTKEKYGTVQKYPRKGVRRTIDSRAIAEEEAEVLVETTPSNFKDGEPGLSNIKQGLSSGKHVVTANKGPLALAMPALLEMAAHKRLQLRFSATVGGGTPFLSFASKCLPGERIVGVHGILNGTTNYILTRMEDESIGYQKALVQAQKKGYAERDPTNDVEGFDTAAKIVIIANWVMKRRIRLGDIEITGISNITPQKLEQTSRFSARIKLIGRLTESQASVRPEKVYRNEPTCVPDTLNSLTFSTEHAGDVTLIGQGAGGEQTASAIIRDLVDIRREYTV
jgi:homoserine dehydrogenase